MFQRILVPLDGSARAERVTPIAVRLGRHVGGEVILLQIISDGVVAPAQESVPWAPRHTEAATYLSQLAIRDEFAGVRTQTIIREGDVVSGILAVAASSAVDLVILNHQRRGDEPTRTPSDVAERVAQEATVSVLLIREQQSLLARAHMGQSRAVRFLIPLDGSLLAETALVPAAIFLDALGGAQPSSLHLAQIVPSAASWRHAARYLAQIAERIRAGALTGHPLIVTWSVIPHVDPAEALIHLAELGEDADSITSWSVARDLGPELVHEPADTAERSVGFQQCDGIIMTAHGRGGFHHLLVGSVTERVLRKSRASLLLVHRAQGSASSRSLISAPDVEQWRT